MYWCSTKHSNWINVVSNPCSDVLFFQHKIVLSWNWCSVFLHVVQCKTKLVFGTTNVLDYCISYRSSNQLWREVYDEQTLLIDIFKTMFVLCMESRQWLFMSFHWRVIRKARKVMVLRHPPPACIPSRVFLSSTSTIEHQPNPTYIQPLSLNYS